jgi:hypothetical protein
MASEAMAGLHGSRHPAAVPHDVSELIWSVPEIISIASRSMQPRPGEVMTGGIDRLGEISTSVP